MKKSLKRTLVAGVAGAVLAAGAGIPANAASSTSSLVPPRTEIDATVHGPGSSMWCHSVIYVFYTPINYQEPRYEAVTACGNETVTKHLVSNHTQVAVAGEEYHLAITASPRG